MPKTLPYLLLIGASTLCADIFTFEPPAYDGSASGTDITGQKGWYTPATGTGSVTNGSVYTYAGNTIGIATNPTGGQQFAGMVSLGGSAGGYARAEHAVNFSGSAVWDFAFDVAVRTTAGSAEQYAGSFSPTKADGTPGVVALAAWDSTSPDSTWSAMYDVYASGGGGFIETSVGNPAWAGLLQNHWYREGMRLNLAANQVLQVWIQDLSGGAISTYSPTGWYLCGGAGVACGVENIRLFAGGFAAGNISAWDNVSVGAVPEPATLLTLMCGIGLLALARKARRRSQGAQ